MLLRGDDGTRTHNPHLAKVVRYQLRHVPEALTQYKGVRPKPLPVSVVVGGDGVGGHVHLGFVFSQFDDTTGRLVLTSQRRAALVARTVEADLDIAATARARDVHVAQPSAGRARPD